MSRDQILAASKARNTHSKRDRPPPATQQPQSQSRHEKAEAQEAGGGGSWEKDGDADEDEDVEEEEEEEEEAWDTKVRQRPLSTSVLVDGAASGVCGGQLCWRTSCVRHSRIRHGSHICGGATGTIFCSDSLAAP